MNRPTKVLIVTHTAQLGGAELALLRLCNAVSPATSSLRVISFESGDLVDQLQRMGVPVDVVPPLGHWQSTSRHATREIAGVARVGIGGAVQAARLAMRIRQLNPDVVQSWTLKAHLVTTVAWPLYRRPLVWFLHDRVTEDYLGRLNVLTVRALARVPDAIIANSQATADTLGRPATVAYPGLSVEQFCPPNSSTRLRKTNPELLLLGRISPTKGQAEAIKSLPVIHEHFPTARLRIVGAPLFGEEGYAARCLKLVKELGLESAVEFAGHTADPRQELDAASVLIHSSPTSEPFGQVIAEAMARNVPVVATDAGGVPELLIRDGETLGLLVPPGDHTALASAVIEVLEHPLDARVRAARAFSVASRVFTIEHTAEVVEDTWRRVIGDGSRP